MASTAKLAARLMVIVILLAIGDHYEIEPETMLSIFANVVI